MTFAHTSGSYPNIFQGKGRKIREEERGRKGVRKRKREDRDRKEKGESDWEGGRQGRRKEGTQKYKQRSK